MARFFKHGFVLGTTSAAALPDVPFEYQAWLRARSSNGGSIYLGSSAVTLPGSTATNATSGIELDAGDLFILQGPGNLSSYYIINDSTVADGLTYMAEG